MFTSQEGLYEFVPQYRRRLENEKKAAEKKAQREKAEAALDDEIEKAKKVRKEWRQLGFKGIDSIFNLNLAPVLLFFVSF
jgi:hypothetical protein